MNSSKKLEQQWEGDVLERKQYANFLYRLLISKYEVAQKMSAESGAICFALDGDWGTGKTFFTTKWAKDIEELQHPVVVFDAWKSDLADDPLIGFIADLRAALKPWADKIPLGAKVKEQVRDEFYGAFRKAGRALYPTAKVIGRGLLKKIAGVESDELVAALGGSTDSALENKKEDELEIRSISNEAIDKLFDQSLDEHEQRITLINEVKDSLQKLLDYLHQHAEARLPLFVFVDELDRCRPTYAIALLEAVKHIFDVPGVCFCVSTNLVQLAESVRGVYGSGFDGSRYLKRFFSFEYSLPEPTVDSFAKVLAERSEALLRRAVVTGLARDKQAQTPTKELIGEVFAFVSRGFGLDLRSQQQVFAVAEAAISGIPADKAVHLRISRQGGHRFHVMAARDFTARRPPISRMAATPYFVGRVVKQA
jgi:KAP family P-loop domain